MWFQCLFFVAVAASIAPLMQAPQYLLQAYQRVQTRTNEVSHAMLRLTGQGDSAQITQEIVSGICWRRVQVGNTVLISADRL